MTDIYPHLVVGGVQALSSDTAALYHPTLADITQSSSSQSNAAAQLDSNVATLRSGAPTLEALQASARSAVTSQSLFTDGRKLAATYPEVEAIATLLDAHRFDDAAVALQARLPNWSVLQNHASELYDSMLANLVLNQNHLVVEVAHRFLKIFWLLQLLNKGINVRATAAPVQDPSRAYRDFIRRFWRVGAISTQLPLPHPTTGAWPTQGFLQQARTASPSARPDFQTLSSQSKALQAAKADLQQAHKLQTARQKTAKLSKEDFISQRTLMINAAAHPTSEPAQSSATVPPKGGSAVQSSATAVAGTADRQATSASPAIDWDQEYRKYAAALGPGQLADDTSAGLAATTRNVLADVGHGDKNPDVREAVAAIDDRMTALYASFEHYPATVPVGQFGGYLVEVRASTFLQSICGDLDLPCHCDLLKQLALKHGERPQVTILGIGNAYRVRLALKRYVRSELVHTEPVLGGTKRTTSFREFDRLEEMQETFTSTETFDEKETTTHDQFSLASQVSNETAAQQQTAYGASISASYGPVTASANYGASSSTASSAAENTAVSNSKEVIESAIKRIQTKAEQTRRVTQLRETERTSSFELDNENKPSFTGFYYAIDKEYDNQLVCVGKRLMIRVAIQQPMAFLLHCMATRSSETAVLQKPIPPSELNHPVLHSLTSFKDIQETNYAQWASLYDAQGIAPPPDNVLVTYGISRDYTYPMETWTAGKAEIEIPDGWVAVWAQVQCLYPGGNSEGFNRCLFGAIGSGRFYQTGINYSAFALDGEQGKLALTYWGHVPEFSINYVISCAPSAKKIEQWKLDVYNAIMDGYNKKKSEYDAQVSTAGIAIEGRNPLTNKMMIEQELQKFVLGALYPPFYYRGFDSMKFGHDCDAPSGALPIPESDFQQAKEELPWVSFFQGLLEWKNMTYQFLPYDFGHRSDWCVLRKLEDVDQFFENAITAGYVVVDVPVAPQMTDAFLYFYNTQQIWNGGDMPAFGDPMFKEISFAIKDAEDLGDGEAVGDPWTTIVPTPLVYVQDVVPNAL